jgi:hypothetical protein
LRTTYRRKHDKLGFSTKTAHLHWTLRIDKYYGTLRRGYIELAKFISDEEGTICEKASLLLIEAESQGKSVENVAEEIRAPWFKKAIQIN